MITQDELKSLFKYEPDTGNFIRLTKTNKAVSIGDVVGCDNGKGYLVMVINRKKYYNHRLVWLYVYGKFPVFEIDHINNIKNDNRIINLREATRRENLRNRLTSNLSRVGLKGVYYHKQSKKWEVKCSKEYLGLYDTPEQASIVYEEHSKKLYGEFYYKHNKEIT